MRTPGRMTPPSTRRSSSNEMLTREASTLALDLLTVTGPLAVTSANRSGAPTPATCEEVRAVFGTAVAVYLCDDGETGGDASTVVDLAGAEPRILREGDLAERVRALLRDER